MFRQINFVAVCLVISLVVSANSFAQTPIAIKGGTIYTMAGDPIENGTVLFRDGRIFDVGKDLKIPVEAKVIDAKGKVVMPGFVESHSSSGMSQANESNPIVPYVSVLDSIDPMSNYFRQARRNGVTTVAISPGNSTIIGGQAAVIKTAGEFLDDMILRSEIGIKISLRPVSGSRMSHMARLRKAMNDARRKMEGDDEDEDKDKDDKKSDDDKDKDKDEKDDEKDDKKEEKKEGSTQAGTAASARQATNKALDEAMSALLSGELPAIIYCERAMDVGQALRLIEEYNLDATLVLGRECHKAAEQLAGKEMPIILDSTLVYWDEDPRTDEETKVVVTEVFREQGIPFTFQGSRTGGATLGSSYLWYQAATCVKHGMPREEALQALTTLPAKFLGVEKLVGSIEKGKDGDVIVLSGDPLKVSTWVEKTIVNGEVVYDREDDEQLKRLLGETEAEE